MTQLQEKQITQRKLAQAAASPRSVDPLAKHSESKLTERDFIARPKFPARPSSQPLPPGVSEQLNREIRSHGIQAQSSPPQNATVEGSTQVTSSAERGVQRTQEPEPEAQKVDPNDASAVRAARGETIRQVAQELVGMGKGFREAPLVLSTSQENNSAIDPVTKLPYDSVRATQVANREQTARFRQGYGSANSTAQKGRAEESALAKLQQPVRDRQHDIILSRTLMNGRGPGAMSAERFGAGRPSTNPVTSFAENARLQSQALRESLLRDQHLYIASVALGPEGHSRVIHGDERALFHAQSLQPNPDRAKTELAREMDRERARIELQLQHQRSEIERNRANATETESVKRVDTFVTRGRWGERFERANVEGAALEMPRSAQLLREIQRRKRNRWNAIFALSFICVLILVLLSADSPQEDPYQDSATELGDGTYQVEPNDTANTLP